MESPPKSLPNNNNTDRAGIVMCCKSAQPFRCMHDHHEEGEQKDEDRDGATDAWRTDAADLHALRTRGVNR